MGSKWMTAALALSLAACVPAAASAQQNGSQASSQSGTQQNMSSGGGQNDQHILDELHKKLSGDHYKDVQETVSDGMVTLSGTVDLLSRKEDADRKAHHISHVAGVRNDIQVAGKQVSDADLRSKLSDKLRYDRVGQGVVFNAFTLDVQNGVVTLGGEVRTDTDHASAVSIVENTPGVKDLNDEVKVAPTSPMDDDIRVAVARRIYNEPALQKYAIDPQAPIRIVVDNGHVTLMGIVDSKMDRQLAEMRAKEVPNVFSVTDRLVVASEQPK